MAHPPTVVLTGATPQLRAALCARAQAEVGCAVVDCDAPGAVAAAAALRWAAPDERSWGDGPALDGLRHLLAVHSRHPDLHTLPVRGAEGTYTAWLGAGLLEEVGGLIADAGLRQGLVVVVSQAAIAARHAEGLNRGLSEAGFAPELLLMPDGEAHKTLATAAQLYDGLVRLGADRSTPVLALGGGVVGDVAGFVAATYLRGTPLVQLPTTLLAMVDSAVGGKTGLDLPQGKNLVGAFKQPALVVADLSTLGTLPVEELRCGLAEALKHGIIGDPELFNLLTIKRSQPLETRTVARALAVKAGVVEADPLELGPRRKLNLGHTFGHAFERASGYGLRHGEAVGVGLRAAALLGVSLGLCDPSMPARITHALTQHGLPTAFTRLDPEQVMAAMQVDKKRRGAALTFVVPTRIGEVTLVEAPDPGAVRAAVIQTTREAR